MQRTAGEETSVANINNALIVGGGIGGMSLAILLAKRGVQVELLDLDPEWRAVGAGLTLNGRSLDAFRRVGVIDEMLKVAHIHEGVKGFNPVTGELVNDMGGREVGAAFTPMSVGGILRPELHRILAEATVASGAKVRLGVTVDAITQDSGGVDVVASDGVTGRYDMVVGADGLQSKLRGLIMPDAPKPTFTGQGCWRAVFDRPDEIESNWIFQGPGYKAGLNPISQDKMYMFMLETVAPNTWREPTQWVELLRERMLAFGGKIHELGLTLDESNSINYRPLESMIVPPPWNVGRVQLIGDAVHPTTPHVGYGAGLAVEDAVVLDEELASGEALDVVLPRFADRRYPRCKMVVEGSAKLGQLEQARAPDAEVTKVFMGLMQGIGAPI
jgi:2-polyprenyl-6-methoxyphenol hydroxylase-like FAD-dependent oxidoreductase